VLRPKVVAAWISVSSETFGRWSDALCDYLSPIVGKSLIKSDPYEVRCCTNAPRTFRRGADSTRLR
jgi:hypothetical protein